ncbi:family 43 glycosylhydrolase [Pontibacter silvestris]|uniref:Family 43 glycosylhydrolase n=1 Tax=Pontibacter silvestris TaxID=2305183 RepID=A0ABW4WZ53_9BACT|nr:family 43 glycosylhydrolase [Pontibacter silvestris]MCC9135354.1 family 43 glycosylhydrolase [Pontibacter silvestris]
MKRINFFLGVASLLSVSCSSNVTSTPETTDAVTLSSEATSYSNPVLAGDYADPSVIRVGDDYWATATSSEWAPLFPLLHSKNLVDWETVGHVFPEQLPEWAEAHFWAPEITYDNGRYYIYYTAKKKGGNLCVGVASANKPTGPYIDHGPLVCQELGSIDGYQIRDEQGDLYLIWKEDGNSRGLPTPIWGQRMNEERTALLGEKFELFRNDPGTWEGGLVEGAALVRRGDYYYAFYSGDACCGRECTYGIGVARAKTLTGPWEKYENNPIMQKNEEWKCPGHGTLVTTPEGKDYFLYHAYSTDASVYAGRQGLLDEVKWRENGWPYFEGRSPDITSEAPTGSRANKATALNVEDEFNTSGLSQEWQWLLNKLPQYSIKSGNNGQLVLHASPDNIGSVVAQRTKSADYSATTAIDKNSLQNGTMAGLAAIGDNENAVGIAVTNGDIIIWTTKSNITTTIAKTAAPASTNLLRLKLSSENGEQMQFAWSTDGKQWNTLQDADSVDASYLPPWDRGVRVGLTVKGPSAATATFDWFRITNDTE